MKKLLLSILMVMSMNAYSTSLLFGHNSVGENIIEGMDALGVSDITISQKYIGENRDPMSKMKDFEALVDRIQTDVAIMKFCYLDIETMNAGDLLVAYIEMVNRIQKKHPDLLILHMSMPLVNNPYDKSLLGMTKGFVRNILGKTPYDPKLNQQRNAFNKGLLTIYGDKVFDLAYTESYNHTHKEYGIVSLYPAYSDDSQHLNDIGKYAVSMEFVRFIRNWSKNISLKQ